MTRLLANDRVTGDCSPALSKVSSITWRERDAC
jgi:hypothetical protein